VHKARKFSAVFGTTSSAKSKVTRPASSPPMSMSKNTFVAIVARCDDDRRAICRREVSSILESLWGRKEMEEKRKSGIIFFLLILGNYRAVTSSSKSSASASGIFFKKKTSKHSFLFSPGSIHSFPLPPFSNMCNFIIIK
jgi:hypothetical protein